MAMRVREVSKSKTLLFAESASSFMTRRGALSALVAHSGGKGSRTAVAGIYHVPFSMLRIMSSF
jgi:hypothetical protein